MRSQHVRVTAITSSATTGSPNHWVGDVEWSDGLRRRVMRYKERNDGPFLFTWWRTDNGGHSPQTPLPVKRLDALVDVLDPFLAHSQAVYALNGEINEAEIEREGAAKTAAEVRERAGATLFGAAREGKWAQFLVDLADDLQRLPIEHRFAETYVAALVGMASTLNEADNAVTIAGLALDGVEHTLKRLRVEREAIQLPPVTREAVVI